MATTIVYAGFNVEMRYQKQQAKTKGATSTDKAGGGAVPEFPPKYPNLVSLLAPRIAEIRFEVLSQERARRGAVPA